VKFDFLVEKILKNKTYVIVSGLHGDEPAGNLALEPFKKLPHVRIFSKINPTPKRRYQGKDLNRHFDDEDKTDLSDQLLFQILELKPDLVISLHEDNEASGLYAYCSPDIKNKVQKILKKSSFRLAKRVHSDKTEKGVITHGKQPYKGSLERALRRRGISYCTLETPSSEDLKKRILCLKSLLKDLIR